MGLIRLIAGLLWSYFSGGILKVVNGGTGIAAFGTGVATALGINVGSAGAVVTNGGALGTPSTGNLTNATIDGTNNLKTYVDSVAAGVEARDARLATAAGLPAYAYANGVAGIGATLIASAFGALTVDGVAVAVLDRILVKNETAGNAPYNGIYTVTATGGGAAFYVLTRALDQDTTNDFAGVLVSINAGTNIGTLWLCTTSLPTVGTTAITFTQFTVSIASGAVTGTLPVLNGGTGQTSLLVLPLATKVFADSPYTALSTDHTLLCNTVGGAITINLPAAATNTGRIYTVKKISSDANAVTIDGNAAETIDGVLTRATSTQYESFVIQCDGSNWHIL